jgi:hypothetical protein
MKGDAMQIDYKSTNLRSAGLAPGADRYYVGVTPQELATLYLRQMRSYGDGAAAVDGEPNALTVWERLICDSPEEAWPVFEEILRRGLDDEALEQVWFRLRLLLYRHYDLFHARARDLLDRNERLRLIGGPKAVDPDVYRDKPFDREALIDAYRVIHRTHEMSGAVNRLAQSDPRRALAIVIEIIHRGIARSMEAFDVMSPLGDVISISGDKVVDELEQIARESVAVRRVLWRLQRRFRWSTFDNDEVTGGYSSVAPDVWERLERVTGQTTDYTDLSETVPRPQKQLDADEAIIEGWFTHDANFWAFSELVDLCEEDPALAWSITLELIDRADDELELGAIAAGPLEDLIRKHTAVIWNDLVARAHTDARFRDALRGVWVFPDDGDVFQLFSDLMNEVDAEPN